jgi:hypothetical protein
MAEEAEEEAHMEQVTPTKHDVREEAHEEQDGSLSGDGDEEGAP